MQSTDNENLIKMASQAVDLAPKPEEQPKGLPVQLMMQFVSLGVLSPRQMFYWFFQGVEPTDFDGPIPNNHGKRR
jgi:hypothetical protein